jgi:anaerobic magnesium-protoporphyrin IX monomethyl ester cyclase
MRVLLIMPPWLDVYGNYGDAARLGCVSPPLGLAYLGAAVEAMGDQCRIVDMQTEKMGLPALINEINEYGPGLIGITSTTPIFNNAAESAQVIKKEFPEILLCIGGVHSTIIGGSLLEKYHCFDLQILGEGEFTLQDILNSIKTGRPCLEDIPGLAYRKNGKVIKNAGRPLTQDLDSLPLPARHLLKNHIYCHTIPGRESVSYANVFTSRGCPFHCIFCSQHTMFGRNMRWHSINRIMSEFRIITQDLGIKHIIFMDETLTLNKPRLREICRAIKDSGLRFTWEGWTHASTIDQEILETMKSAGMIRISFGIESGDPEILKTIKKGVSLQDIRKAYKIAHKVGIETRGSAMLGHPDETLKTAWRTIRFCRSIKECQQIFLNVVCPYPGTELYDIAKNNSHGMKLLSMDYSKYKRYGEPVISVNDLGPRDLKRLQALGLLYFYFTPRRIWYNMVRRAGIKAGLINALAFLKGVMSGMSIGKTVERSAGEGIPERKTQMTGEATWDKFWDKRTSMPLGNLLSWFRGRFVTSVLVDYIIKNTEKGILIEAGCGTGETTLKTAKLRGDQAVLVDRSEPALEQAKRSAKHYGVHADFLKCDIRELSAHVRPDPKNIVYNVGVAEHFSDPAYVLREMARASGLYAIAIVPEHSIFWTLFHYISKALKLIPPDFFVVFYNRKRLLDLAESAGLEVKWMRGIRVLGMIPYVGICFSAKDPSLLTGKDSKS